ncbi:hypothetical protein [Paenibacillus endoradicis]|uniref:hypothetical protein n=1 Tax=Paenibacillus endoradicis TaxID=2972487 RepID=UPI002158BFE8|nr:hypothetical protein [Paenibacillus endoradicis]MCR8656395.1 hypothetical protein [Paenibacillus endoradicis]
MSDTKVLTISAEDLVTAWQEKLSTLLKSSDECTVQADAKFPDTLLIHIENAGRTHYSFDFRCKYVDDREVHVEFIDVEKDQQSTDEQSDIIQSLAKDYVKHIHECAQHLKELTQR